MHRSRASKTLLLYTFILLAAISLPTAAANDRIWSSFDEEGLPVVGDRRIVPDAYRPVELNWTALAAVLERAPLERSNDSRPAAILTLPLPNGDFGRFEILESPIMERALAASFPDLRTYRGQGIDDVSATLRFDTTPHGFHAAILSPSGNVYIDPYSRGDIDHYVSYFTSDYRSPAAAEFRCEVTTRAALPLAGIDGQPRAASGSQLREYRIAVAATGEYTSFHGGTVGDGMAAIVTAMNRVNGVYEREVAIRMNLVANNNLVVYTDGATDPYSNNSGGAMLSQNQSTLDAVIGDANYDIGHVFSTGGGGVAFLRVPCVSGSKAGGVTGLSSPIGDVFFIDFVAHEMGHQWGGNHSFNGSSGNCSGGNRNASTAYEPGSGTTIMAYAGICSPQNIQSNSDDYFHGISFDEIVSYSTIGNGDTCAATSATGNDPPSVSAGGSFTIPVETPFQLCLGATDPDSDPLTFNWEQFDRGPAGHPNSPVGDAPLFRSFPATASSCRTFPQLSDLLANTQTMGEILPTYSRTLHFRLTARDNRSGGGGVDFDQSTVVDVTDQAGPFLVTSPNTNVTWNGGTSETVTWDVANTDLAPVDCLTVDILLSVDGGMSYQHELALNTANDGSETFVLPTSLPSTTEARLEVLCADNVFFDISDSDFTVIASLEIFADDFETGDTAAWTSSVP